MVIVAAVLWALAAGCATGEPVGGTADGGSDARDAGQADVPVQLDAPPFVIDAPTCPALSPPEGSGAACGGGDKGTLADNGAAVSVTGNLEPDTSEDWYTFTAQDSVGAVASGCDLFHVTVRLTSNPGAGYVFDVFRGACPAALDGGAPPPDGGAPPPDGGAPPPDGGAPPPDGGAGAPEAGGGPPCLGEAARFDWYTDMSVVTDAGAVGECPCGGDPDAGPAPGSVRCTDDTQRFHVRVRRAPGQPASCDPYVLELSNGKYHGVFP